MADGRHLEKKNEKLQYLCNGLTDYDYLARRGVSGIWTPRANKILRIQKFKMTTITILRNQKCNIFDFAKFGMATFLGPSLQIKFCLLKNLTWWLSAI